MFVFNKKAFEKFWSIFDRQDRGISKWDNRRTDQDVFIRRTLSKWFEGKSYQIDFDKYIPVKVGFNSVAAAHRFKYTMYVFVIRIGFTFSAYHDQITVEYAQPHSTSIERMDIERRDWSQMKIREDKESWTILRRFYPLEKNNIELPAGFRGAIVYKEEFQLPS